MVLYTRCRIGRASAFLKEMEVARDLKAGDPAMATALRTIPIRLHSTEDERLLVSKSEL